MLTDADVIRIVRTHIESKFPKACPTCGRRYDTLADYLTGTIHVGHPVSADDPHRATETGRLFGAISYADCPCGSTLSISSDGLDAATKWRLLQWAGVRMAWHGISIGALLNDLRRRIDEAVLSEHAAHHRR